MNKLEELEKQYAKLGEEIEKLKKGKEEKYFVPEEYEGYYMLAGNEAEHNYNNSDYDKEVLERQMVYKTEEEAKFYDQKRIYETDYRKYLLNHEEEPVDWKDENQIKYCACFGYNKRTIKTEWTWILKNQGSIYTTRQESIYEFAKQIGEDNFIKYILMGEYKED